MKTSRILLFVSFIIVLTFTGCNHVFGQSEVEPFLIMIDPGHGGRDGGTPGTGRYKTTEKHIALDVSLALGKMIESKLPNVKVRYTRKKDVFPSLNDRARVANHSDVDLFISIHCNAQPGKRGTAYGSETYVLGITKNKQNLEVAKRENSVISLEDNYEETYKDFNPNSHESTLALMLAQEDYLDHSIELASYIENEFKHTAKRKTRGVKQNIFYVLAYTYMPSVLVELGFLTHKKEEDFLNSKKGKAVMTKSLFNAVKKYVKNHAQAVSVSENSTETNSGNREITNADNLIFKVQIAASSKSLETKPYNFKGLNNVSRAKENNLYKYFYGETSNYNTIKKLEEEAKTAGFKTGYIVAFKNGKKISLTEALKTTAN
ncbi:N-acetylmuramoyl-L-alanine amidase family protein [Gelatiniphilus marinus]|uniref:N-acetylmuramoyl-L-alanine amidase n=1 Tax=Gelatiniphilus marinus TaxID=1759464 RepID=A0ABW5JPQ8_9FLAO